MKILVYNTPEEMCNAAAWVFLREAVQPRGIIGLATGTTTAPIHERIAELYRLAPFDTSRLVTCNVDDYAGLPPDTPASCHWRIRRQLLDPLGITEENGMLPDGTIGDPEEAAAAYERRIEERGGIGLQILGLGPDAHLGFCRGGTPFGQGAHAVVLPDDTKALLIRLYSLPQELMPTHGITLGLKSIMQTRQPLVVARGAAKAPAVEASILGPITERVPASVLQLHRNALWMLDREAAKGILGKVAIG